MDVYCVAGVYICSFDILSLKPSAYTYISKYFPIKNIYIVYFSEDAVKEFNDNEEKSRIKDVLRKS